MSIPAGEISVVGSSGWLLLRALLSLGVVLALAVVLLRFVLPRLTLRRAGGKRVEVLEVVPLDPKNKLVLVRAFDRELLVGVGVGGLHPLGGPFVVQGAAGGLGETKKPPTGVESQSSDGKRSQGPTLVGRVR